MSWSTAWAINNLTRNRSIPAARPSVSNEFRRACPIGDSRVVLTYFPFLTCHDVSLGSAIRPIPDAKAPFYSVHRIKHAAGDTSA